MRGSEADGEFGHRPRSTNCVVAAIAAVCVGWLIAVLWPLLTAPHGGRSPCSDHLREMAIALHTYCSDYDGALPSSAIVSHSKRWSKSDFLRFAARTGHLPPRGRPRTLTEALYPCMKSKDIMFCPSDPADPNAPNSPPSYWWKVAIDKAWYGVDCSKPYGRAGDFTYDADQIVFYEHNSWHFEPANGLINGARINVAYLDTHVRCVTLRNATTGDPINCAANTNGEPMYFNFDNKRVEQTNVNPPRAEKAARYVDPGRYSDILD